MPLVLLVALAAHWAGFGTSHAMGGTHGNELLAAVLAGLGLLAGLAILRVALAARKRLTTGEATSLLEAALPAAGRIGPQTLVLAVGGALAYGAAEALEGHTIAGSPAALLALPLAAFVLVLAVRAVTRLLAGVGLALAALVSEIERIAPHGVTSTATYRFAFCPAELHRRDRGRAPPIQA